MDRFTEKQRSANMRAIRSEGMKPELWVRKTVHRMGYRYRLHRRDLPGKPDLVFPRRRKVIFVHGCFWHQHPDPDCKRAHAPRSNLEYWKPKLQRNVERDEANRGSLEAAGWHVLVIWECETAQPDWAKEKIAQFLAEMFSET